MGEPALIYKPTKAMQYDPPLPVQPVDFVDTFVQTHVPAKVLAKQGRGSLGKHSVVLHREIIRTKGRRRRKKRILLTCKEKRKLGIFNIQNEKLQFKSFLPIHEMWKDYFRDAVGKNVSEAGSPALLKAEYCGCFLVIAAARCPSYVGQRGIVVQETKNVFRLVTTNDRVITVPKAHSLFAFELDGRLFKIYGSHFRVHSFERIKAKFKVRGVVGL